VERPASLKHARRVIGSHPRYMQFDDYGDAEGFQKRAEALRASLAKEE